MHTEIFKQPLYRVKKRKLDRWAKKWLKQARILQTCSSSNERINPTAPREKLYRGVEIEYYSENIPDLLIGIIWKRRSNDLTVLCLDRSEVHLITLYYGRTDCQNYSVKIAKQQLETLKKQNARKKNLMRFVSEMEKMIHYWIESGRFPRSSYVNEVASQYRRCHKVPASQLALTFKFMSLLLRAYGQ